MSLEELNTKKASSEEPKAVLLSEKEEEKESAIRADEEAGTKENGNDSGFHIPMRFTKSGRKRAVPFPLKLMKVLTNKELEHIITWTPTGKSFLIVDPKAFVATVLPEEFKSAKYASFTRKLHRWGFLRHYRGEEAGAFYHKHFQRDSPDLVEKMTCFKTETPATGTQTNTPSVARKLLLPKQQRNTTSTNSTETQLLLPPQQIMGPSSAVASKPAAQPQSRQNESIPQLQQQQQQQINLPQMGSMAERLNAAIELEVARRLQERIQAATLSRHNLALLNHNQFDQRQTPMNMPWNVMNGNLQAQLLYKLQQQKQQQQLVNPQVASQMENKGLEKMPTTNIQGAKTA